jgi:hypothetical protein
MEFKMNEKFHTIKFKLVEFKFEKYLKLYTKA